MQIDQLVAFTEHAGNAYVLHAAPHHHQEGCDLQIGLMVTFYLLLICVTCNPHHHQEGCDLQIWLMVTFYLLLIHVTICNTNKLDES